jgi:hypothetical protein
MPANKTLICTAKGCEYTARRPLVQMSACHGHKETPAESALCPHGHGPMVERIEVARNRKPRIGPGDRVRRHR